MAVVKTTLSCVEAMKDMLASSHPYECPEFLVFEVADGLDPYLDWVRENASGARKNPRDP